MARWTEEELEYLRVNYKGTHDSCREIGEHLGRGFWAARSQIGKHGWSRKSARRMWTPEEEERLPGLLRQYSALKVARMMGRSVNSVVVRGNRLHISRRIRDGWFTKQEAAEICGVDHKKTQRWIDRGELVASYHNGHRPGRVGLAMWHIKERDLMRFICEHAMELNGRNVDLVAIVGLLRRD
jgi:hypothetical protein